jgi:centromeric protein E
MGSNLSKDVNRERDLGMIPRSLNYIFSIIKKCEDYEFTAKMSLIEIYNEEIIDLLNYKAKSKSFTLREDKSGEVFITGLTESDINDSEEAFK